MGGNFDIQIIATQLTFEDDSFNNQYDADATLDYAPVSTANKLKVALANEETNILLTKDIVVDESYNVTSNAYINGNGYTLYRPDGTSLLSTRAATTT